MTKATDRIIDRITKMLRLSKDEAASEGEVENALRFARQLMDKYNIEEQSIILEETIAETAKRIVDELVHTRRHFRPYYASLIQTVCAICDVRYYFDRNVYAKDKKTGEPDYLKQLTACHLYGQKHDVAVATALFKELCVTMRTMAYHHYGHTWMKEHANYCKGFSRRLYSRSLEFKRESQNDPNCTALVIRKDEALEEFAKGLGLVPSRRRSTSISDWGAYTQGDSDGKHVSLSTNGIGGTASHKKLK